MVEVGVSGGLLPVWCVVSLLLAQSGYRTLVGKGGSVTLIVLSLAASA